MDSTIILYTLDEDGNVPSYVLNGGYFFSKNNSSSPQDYNILGIGSPDISDTNLPENCIRIFSGREEIEEYINNLFQDQLEEITPEDISNSVDFILNLQENQS